MASNYVDLYHNVDDDTMTEQEGIELHGRDGVFCTSPVYADIPLLTENQDFARAINELFGQGTGANGAFRAVFDDNAGNLTIVVQEGEKYADYQFGYEYTDYSDEITTQTVVGEETVKTTRSFSKRIVTLLFDASGAVLLVTDYNADNGVIFGYNDGSGDVIHTAEWRDEYEAVVSQSQGASSAAIAWVIARNLEQSTSLSEEKQAYKDGLKLGVEGGADFTEEYTKEGNQITIPTNKDGQAKEPFIGSLTDGIYAVNSDGQYVHIWLDMSYEDVKTETNSFGVTTTTTQRGQLVYDAYDTNGTLIASASVVSSSNWAWQYYKDYSSGTSQGYDVIELIVGGSRPYDVTGKHQYYSNGKPDGVYTADWSPPAGEIRVIMSNTVRITNIPPETIN